MGSLFSWFYDKIAWLFNWFYDGFTILFSVVLTGISFILFVLVGYLLKLLGWMTYAGVYLLDFFLTSAVSFLGWFAGSDGIFAKFGITLPSGVFASIAQQTSNAVYAINSYVSIDLLLRPLKVYISFILAWTVYKLVKSWIPTVGA